MAAGTAGTRPRVVIVDAYLVDAFRAFDVALRRLDVDVLYLRPDLRGAGSGLRTAIDRVMGPAATYSPALLQDTPEGARLRRAILGPPTVDVHAAEPLLASLAATPEWAANPALAKVRPGVSLADVADKLAVARLASEAGVPVPAATTDLSPDRFPVVVKGSLGVGGLSVRIVSDPAELPAAVAAVGAEGGQVYLEEFHAGETLGTAGVALDGQVLAQCTFGRSPNPRDPLAPPSRIRLLDDPVALERSERLMGALGYTGIWCLNFVPGDDGSPLLIDVNVRQFGSWLAIEEAGVPLLATYVAMLRGSRTAPPSPVPPAVPADAGGGPWLDVPRISVDRIGTLPTIWTDVRTTSAKLRPHRRRLGWPWTIANHLRLGEEAVLATARTSARAARRRTVG